MFKFRGGHACCASHCRFPCYWMITSRDSECFQGGCSSVCLSVCLPASVRVCQQTKKWLWGSRDISCSADHHRSGCEFFSRCLFRWVSTMQGPVAWRLVWCKHSLTGRSREKPPARRLWFLKKLKRAGIAREDPVYFYQAVIRLVLEYACLAWHASLTKDQKKSLEDI